VIADVRKKFFAEVGTLGLPRGPGSQAPVSDADLEALPEPAQRYFRYRGELGRPRIWSFRARWTGRFLLGKGGRWCDCEAWQYNTCLDLARIFYMRLKVGPVPMLGRDTYLRGQGRMIGKALDLFKVVDASGREFDIGELVTYLNDAVLIAPSMLLRPEARFSPVDAGSFDVSLTDRTTTVGARVFVDAAGAVRDFSTTDRFYYRAKERDTVRARWTTPVSEWRECDGRRVPSRGQAIWQFAEGPLPYADFRLDQEAVAFNVPPGG